MGSVGGTFKSEAVILALPDTLAAVCGLHGIPYWNSVLVVMEGIWLLM